MSTVSVSQTFPGSIHAAEIVWYDTARWSSWVEGLASVEETTDNWPATGSRVVWHSGPAGRGRVTEKVTAYEPRLGQTSEITDDSIDGSQSVAFRPAGEDESGDQVSVELTLTYEIRKRSLFTPVVDRLFVRRVWRLALNDTLDRFGAELAATQAQDKAQARAQQDQS